MTIDLRPADYLSHEELRALAYAHAHGHISAAEVSTFLRTGLSNIRALLNFRLVEPAYGARGDEYRDRYVPTGGNDLAGNKDHQTYLTVQYHRAWCEALSWSSGRQPGDTNESNTVKQAATELGLTLPAPQNPASFPADE